MNRRMDVRAWIRITWLLTAVVVAGIGIACIWWPQSEEISRHHARALELYDEANTFDAQTRRASQLRAAQSRITSDLSQLGGTRSAGAITAAFLQLLHEESTRQNVDVREVAPDTSAHASPSFVRDAAAVRTTDNVLATTDVAISLRGPFRNIVAFVSDLPRHDVLIDVRDIQLSSTQTVHRPPVLDVTLHTTMYRLVSTPTAGSSRVRTLR